LSKGTFSSPQIFQIFDSPAPIAYAAATSEGVDYSTGPVLHGALAFIILVLLAALFYLPWFVNAAFALPRPDALSPPPAAPVLCQRSVYADTTHIIPDDMGIPSSAVLVLSGRGYAPFASLVGVVGLLRPHACIDGVV
jgi:hypothetical protein